MITQFTELMFYINVDTDKKQKLMTTLGCTDQGPVLK